MNKAIRIGIVEDELLIAENIRRLLMEMGYETGEAACNYDEGLEMLATQKPDLVLVDINLNDERDGIHLAQKINDYGIPFIFLTANSDSLTVERAKEVNPYAYIVKPFTAEELFTSIEIAFNNYSRTKATEQKQAPERDFLFVRDDYRFIKIRFADIVYIESKHNYISLHTSDKKDRIIRSSISDFHTLLPKDFVRVHRSFIVQLQYIEGLEPTELLLNNGGSIPVSNSYKEELYRLLGIQ